MSATIPTTRVTLRYERAAGSSDYADAVEHAVDALVNALAADGWHEIARQPDGLTFTRAGDDSGIEWLTIAPDPV